MFNRTSKMEGDIVGNMNLREIPDELQMALKIRAIEERTTLRELVIRYCQEGLDRDKKAKKKKGG